MQVLNFPTYKFRLKSSENRQLIFDIIRKKYVVLTPEEWVRQHVIHFLIEEKKYPTSLIAIEKQLKVNNLIKRFDILVFNNKGLAEVIIECKSPSVKVNQKTFDQIARYNLQLKANFLMLTNGIQHYFCKLDYQKEAYTFLKELPTYK